MQTLNIKLSVTIAFFLFYLGISPLAAQQMRAVVLESQGDRVIINRGSQDGVQVGQTWVLGAGEPTGAILIDQLNDFSSSGVLRGQGTVGTLAALGDANVRIVEKSALPPSAEHISAETPIDQRSPGTASLATLEKRYENALNQKTAKRRFSTKIPGTGGSGIPTREIASLGWQVYNISRLNSFNNSFGLGGSSFYNPWWLAASAAGNVASGISRRKQISDRKVKVDVEAIYWDRSLVDIRTEVAGVRQGLSSPEIAQQKALAHRQSGLDQYAVFELYLKNTGKIPANMGNFQNKIFLISAEGQAMTASQVDPILSQTLQPGAEIRGMVYFPKIIAAGQEELKLSFEQMFGDRGELKFRNSFE